MWGAFEAAAAFPVSFGASGGANFAEASTFGAAGVGADAGGASASFTVFEAAPAFPVSTFAEASTSGAAGAGAGAGGAPSAPDLFGPAFSEGEETDAFLAGAEGASAGVAAPAGPFEAALPVSVGAGAGAA